MVCWNSNSTAGSMWAWVLKDSDGLCLGKWPFSHFPDLLAYYFLPIVMDIFIAL